MTDYSKKSDEELVAEPGELSREDLNNFIFEIIDLRCNITLL